ncbi:50S ribosomal protein L23 [Candidatus Gottesmanbacteria bacterium RIFCSPHIGHO2_01_FULL_39_10]|uniref:Large ribosomal subunit protein uL23 n=1 Tax=Candidatus Gottesmanbacteria bacterium RIFCSPHIGHO2_01_FULL_39_10 TaxID=1798375 RepID=A0A1F5ZRQ5_9BACT|nr:MAG: 50S ribosomal protein L23 [Candidatus Gottesmanbacteria bacterium RIFCSPHIGHO2_01_FULL_39_10]
MTDNILLKPIITESSLKDANLGVFTFMVKKYADKIRIKDAVEKQFQVHVKNISTIKVKGKKRMIGKRRTKVSKPDWKKAKVKLSAGEKISLFETETQK